MPTGNRMAQRPYIKEELPEGITLQSPSSILTYKQCPRKYFYRYIARLPTTTSIHLLRGSIAHTVMEQIYDIDTANIPDEQFLIILKVVLQERFRAAWEEAREELTKLGMPEGELERYFEETRTMINNFFHYLVERMRAIEGVPTKETFQRIKPTREVELRSKTHYVRGFADAIHEEGGKRFILDYKTSSKCEITDDYLLQLSIYGMIAEELGIRPDEVGIFFLKHGQEIRLTVTDDMIERAREEVKRIHEVTRSRDIADYPKCPSPLCKWSTGQCDFYETCWSKTLLDYDETPKDLLGIGKRKG